MARTEIPYKTAWLVEAVAPVNRSTIPHDPLNNESTTQDDVPTTLAFFSKDAGEEDLVITNGDAHKFLVGDVISMALNDGEIFKPTVVVSDKDAEITVGYDILIIDPVVPSTNVNFSISLNAGSEITGHTGARCSFKVFDPGKNEEISASEAIGQTVISVTNPGVFAVNDTVEILMDDAAFHAATISAIDLTAKTITISAGLTVAAAAGNSVRRNFGPTVTMTEYGTANLQDLAFGYRGALAHDGVYQIIDQDIDIEVSFDGGTGLEVFSVICGTITRVCV